MTGAAHVGSFEHEVYTTPLNVNPRTELWDRPDNYLRYDGGDELPKKMKVWLVQQTGDESLGVVSSDKGFLDNKNAEIIALGYNVGKYYGAVGIARDKNFLQWGYHAPPSKMTPAGKKLFINCIKYITKFK